MSQILITYAFFFQSDAKVVGGSTIYQHIYKQLSKKLDHKSRREYFVGYRSPSIYRIYHPDKDIIVESHNVTFSKD